MSKGSLTVVVMTEFGPDEAELPRAALTAQTAPVSEIVDAPRESIPALLTQAALGEPHDDDLIAFLNADQLALADWSTRLRVTFAEQEVGVARSTVLTGFGNGAVRADDSSARVGPYVFRRRALTGVSGFNPASSPGAALDAAVAAVRAAGWREAVHPELAVLQNTRPSATLAERLLRDAGTALASGIGGREDRPVRVQAGATSSPSGAHVDVVVVDDAESATRHLEARHVAWATADPQRLTAVQGPGSAIVWLHAVSVADRVMGAISDRQTRISLITEAALLHEVRAIVRRTPHATIRDLRTSRLWPLDELVGTPDEALEGRVAGLVRSATAVPPGEATSVANQLLDERAFPVPTDDQIARAVTKPADQAVRPLLELLLQRRLEGWEVDAYLPLIANRDGRAQLLRNFGAAERCDLHEFERRGLVGRLWDAFELDPDECVNELFWVILGRAPREQEHTPRVWRLRHDGHGRGVAAELLTSEEAAVQDPAAWPPRLGSVPVLAERLGVGLAKA